MIDRHQGAKAGKECCMRGGQPFCRAIVAAIVLTGIFNNSSPAAADELADVKARGSLTCGTLTGNPPFGYLDAATRQPVGFDVDICAAVAAQLGVKMEHKGLSLENRVTELSLGRLDIVSAALAYSKERAEQIGFSAAYYQQPLKVIVQSDSGVHNFNDLKGKRISATKGSLIEKYILEQIPDVTIVNFQDTTAAFLALSQGKVQALGMSNSSGVRYINETGSKFQMLDQTLSLEPSALGLRKGEQAFIDAVDAALQKMNAAGEIEKIWNKWFGPETAYKIPLGIKLTPVSQLNR
jgi:polar amino acid transport system substrate-binding protein